MTQTPQQPAAIVNATPAPGNGLGVAGFITSLVGTLLCGTLAPLGLLLSFFALFKRPRGFAIAGVIIKLFGTALIAGIVAAVIGAGAIASSLPNTFALAYAQQQIEGYRHNAGALPSDIDGNAAISGSNAPPMGEQPVYQRVSD